MKSEWMTSSIISFECVCTGYVVLHWCVVHGVLFTAIWRLLCVWMWLSWVRSVWITRVRSQLVTCISRASISRTWKLVIRIYSLIDMTWPPENVFAKQSLRHSFLTCICEQVFAGVGLRIWWRHSITAACTLKPSLYSKTIALSLNWVITRCDGILIVLLQDDPDDHNDHVLWRTVQRERAPHWIDKCNAPIRYTHSVHACL